MDEEDEDNGEDVRGELYLYMYIYIYIYLYIAVLILSFSVSIAFSADWIQGPRLGPPSRDLHEDSIIQTLFDNLRVPRSRLKAYVCHTFRRPNLDETV